MGKPLSLPTKVRKTENRRKKRRDGKKERDIAVAEHLQDLEEDRLELLTMMGELDDEHDPQTYADLVEDAFRSSPSFIGNVEEEMAHLEALMDIQVQIATTMDRLANAPYPDNNSDEETAHRVRLATILRHLDETDVYLEVVLNREFDPRILS